MSSNFYDPPYFRPPTTATPYPSQVQLGQIVLFKDDNWSSDSLTIDTTSSLYTEGQAFSFAGTKLQDAATWIAFCLPIGTVCTLFDNVVKKPPQNAYDFSGLGVCVDLIGNGATQTVDLKAYGADNALSAGIWRQVTLSEGWFQLFSGPVNQGPFNTIFIDEWPTGEANSLSGWWINQKGTSINCPCLTPPQVLVLSVNSDGSGQQVALGATNPFETWNNNGVSYFSDSGMNGKIQSFMATLIQPVQAIILSTTTNYTVAIPQGQTIIEPVNSSNGGSQNVEIQLPVAEGQTYSITQTTTLQYTMSTTISTTVTVTEGIKDVDQTSGSITTSFTTSSSQTASKTTTDVQSFQLGATITFLAPPKTNYSASASVSFGTLPQITLTTQGQFYYEQDLPGSVLDPPSGLYVLTTPVVINVAGAVGTQVSFNVTSTPDTSG